MGRGVRASNFPLFFAGEISVIYVGTAIVETPMPRPPINLKKENDKGPFARAEPIADIKYNIPINTRVLFLPNLSFGNAPKIAPITVPHSAIDTTTIP